LTEEFDGDLAYNHQEWVRFRMVSQAQLAVSNNAFIWLAYVKAFLDYHTVMYMVML